VAQVVQVVAVVVTAARVALPVELLALVRQDKATMAETDGNKFQT
jgi:hypothetical protein